MMRRPMARGRRGILGTVATTAVVAGTATAVSNRVTDHQVNKQAAQTNEQYAQQAAYDSQAQLQDMQAQLNTMQAQQVQAAATAGRRLRHDGAAPAAHPAQGGRRAHRG